MDAYPQMVRIYIYMMHVTTLNTTPLCPETVEYANKPAAATVIARVKDYQALFIVLSFSVLIITVLTVLLIVLACASMSRRKKVTNKRDSGYFHLEMTPQSSPSHEHSSKVNSEGPEYANTDRYMPMESGIHV